MADHVTHKAALQRSLASKAVRRQELARLPYEQKIALALELRTMALSMKQAVVVTPTRLVAKPPVVAQRPSKKRGTRL
jgi:hypothetical protein